MWEKLAAGFALVAAAVARAVLPLWFEHRLLADQALRGVSDEDARRAGEWFRSRLREREANRDSGHPGTP